MTAPRLDDADLPVNLDDALDRLDAIYATHVGATLAGRSCRECGRSVPCRTAQLAAGRVTP